MIHPFIYQYNYNYQSINLYCIYISIYLTINLCMSIYIYPYVYMYKYIHIYVYVNIDLFISVLTMVYLLFYLFIDLQVLSIYLSIQLSIYLSIYLFQSDLTYSSSSSLSICLLSIDYAFISNTLGASSEFGAKKRWDFYWNPVFPRGGSRTTSWNTSQQPIPSHWVVFVSYQAIPDPLKQRIPFSAKVLQLKKKQSTCFLHVPIN